MQRFAIHTASSKDVPGLRDVYRRSSLSNEGDRASLMAHPEVLAFDASPVSEQRTRVAVDGERIVGFATIRLVTDFAELDDLFVDPDWMRQGIGRALVLDATEIARSLLAKRIEVTANPHALEFYETVGFVVAGVAATQLGSGLRMQLSLVG